jgi:hypothetical protein
MITSPKRSPDAAWPEKKISAVSAKSSGLIVERGKT